MYKITVIKPIEAKTMNPTIVLTYNKFKNIAQKIENSDIHYLRTTLYRIKNMINTIKTIFQPDNNISIVISPDHSSFIDLLLFVHLDDMIINRASTQPL